MSVKRVQFTGSLIGLELGMQVAVADRIRPLFFRGLGRMMSLREAEELSERLSEGFSCDDADANPDRNWTL